MCSRCSFKSLFLFCREVAACRGSAETGSSGCVTEGSALGNEEGSVCVSSGYTDGEFCCESELDDVDDVEDDVDVGESELPEDDDA